MSNFAIILKKSSTYLLPILTGKGDIGEVTAGPEIPAHKDGRGGDDHSEGDNEYRDGDHGDDDHGGGDDHNHGVKVPEGCSGGLLKLRELLGKKKFFYFFSNYCSTTICLNNESQQLKI